MYHTICMHGSCRTQTETNCEGVIYNVDDEQGFPCVNTLSRVYTPESVTHRSRCSIQDSNVYELFRLQLMIKIITTNSVVTHPLLIEIRKDVRGHANKVIGTCILLSGPLNLTSQSCTCMGQLYIISTGLYILHGYILYLQRIILSWIRMDLENHEIYLHNCNERKEFRGLTIS